MSKFIPSYFEMFGEKGDIDTEWTIALDFIRDRNTWACVPVEDEVLASIQFQIQEDGPQKQRMMLRLAQILSRFSGYKQAYFFYLKANCDTTNPDNITRRRNYQALLGAGRLLFTCVIGKTMSCKERNVKYRPLFEYLDTQYPDEEASCFL